MENIESVTSRQINPFTLNILCETQVVTYSSSLLVTVAKKNHNCRECCLQDKHFAGFCPGLIWKLRLLMFVRARAQKNLCLDTTSHFKKTLNNLTQRKFQEIIIRSCFVSELSHLSDRTNQSTQTGKDKAPRTISSCPCVL